MLRLEEGKGRTGDRQFGINSGGIDEISGGLGVRGIGGDRKVGGGYWC